MGQVLLLIFKTCPKVQLFTCPFYLFKTILPLEEYLDYYGRPIRYSYVKESYPQSYYQTVFAREMGSAEMPSAGRAFTPELIVRLLTKGVQIVPLLLHTGVASLEADERPYEEYYRISAGTADSVNLAREQGRRIIAVGTTVVRALEGVWGFASNFTGLNEEEIQKAGILRMPAFWIL